MRVQRLSDRETIPSGFTHGWRITHEDLTTAAAATEQVLTLRALDLYDQVGRVAVYLEEELEDVSDSAFNTTKVEVGHTDTDNAFIAATEFNANGTVVPAKAGQGTYVCTAASKALTCTVGSMSAKSLVNIDKGVFYVFANIQNLAKLADWGDQGD